MRLEAPIHWLQPRPAYPHAKHILARAARVYLRDILLGIGLILAVSRPYAALAAAWDDDRTFFVLCAFVAHTGTCVLFNGAMYLISGTSTMRSAHLDRKPAEVPTRELRLALLRDGLVNHLLTSPAGSYWLVYPLAVAGGMGAPASPLPGPARCAWLLAAAHLVNDWSFYWTHRALHVPVLYALFHKQHHAFRGSVGPAAEYAHPVEILLSNHLPTVGTLLALGAHPLVQLVWIVLRLTQVCLLSTTRRRSKRPPPRPPHQQTPITKPTDDTHQTYEVHSGYQLNDTLAGRLGLTANDTAFHDHHHTVNRGNFGAEHMDWLLGTMDHFVSMGGGDGYVRQRKRSADA